MGPDDVEGNLPDGEAPQTPKEFAMARRRKLLRCPFCRPNKGENRKRKPKHGVRKPPSK